MPKFGISLNIARDKDSRPAAQGRFSVPATGDIDYAGHSRGALVLVLSTSFGYLADRPFKNQIPFEDDVRVVGDTVIGEFAFSLDEFIDFEQEDLNTYYMLISIGPYLSNVEVFEA